MFTPFRAPILPVLGLAAVLAVAVPASAQVAPCSASEPTPPTLPPAGSPPLLRCIELFFHPENQAVVDRSTYAYYLKSKPSQMSRGVWSPYDEDSIQSDFWNLWRTNFLDNLWVEVIDEPYSNGVMGKHVVFHMEERARVKIVDYKSAGKDEGKLKVDVSKIESTMRDKGVEVRLDSFVDQTTIRRVEGIIKDLYAEKGYEAAEVTPVVTPMEGGPKLIHLTFRINEGPEYQIKDIVFDGAKAFSSSTLVGQLKDNKPRSWLSFVTDAGTYQEQKWGDDATKVTAFYHDHGYARALVGDPKVEVIEDAKDGKTRWIRLRVPVDEGPRYKVGKIDISGNTLGKTDYIRSLFKLKEGDYYDESKIRKGREKAQELYGAAGFMEFTAEPVPTFRGLDEQGKPIGPDPPPPILDLDIHFNEGKQYFVNRITFVGNTTTHDTVVRRELRLVEGGVFDSEALKYSIRRINQLGYFKPLESNDAIQIEKTPGQDGRVDVRLKFQEQNRNQISFGAGVSQIDGFFGQISFQTANFLGRGETVGVSLQKGSQAKNYQVSFSEPFLFDRPITAGVDLYSRQFIYPLQFTEQSTGGNLVFGFPVSSWTRMFMGYSYEEVRVPQSLINPSYLAPSTLQASPYLRDELLIDHHGRRTVSKVSPSLVYNTVNEPIFPTSGRQLTAAFDFAGLGGDTDYWQTRLEGIFYFKMTSRTSLGLRLQGQYIRPFGSTTTLPIFEKLFLGGEYSVRGYDLRSIGPRDPVSDLVIGGNKTLLFNAEYSINVGGPVRAILFYDAGEVRDIGQRFSWNEPVVTRIVPPTPLLTDPTVLLNLVSPAPVQTAITGRTSAVKTSTGLEVRFFMPVLNIPFRLIFAYNPQRTGVLDNNLLQTKKFTFRFAVGTTF